MATGMEVAHIISVSVRWHYGTAPCRIGTAASGYASEVSVEWVIATWTVQAGHPSANSETALMECAVIASGRRSSANP